MKLLMRYPVFALVFVYVVSLYISGFEAIGQTTTTTTSTSSSSTSLTSTSTSLTTTTMLIAPQKTAAAPAKPKKEPKNMFAILDTTKGKIKIKLLKDNAPKTVENFVGLAEGTKEYLAEVPENPNDPNSRKARKKMKSHFYDGVIFHRVIDGFMIQTGDPQGTGFGGPGFVIPDEIDKSLKHDKPGIVAMANTGRPNSAGSQFYITVSEQSHLDGGYTIFGVVVEGMDVVHAISKVKVGPGDRPVEPIKINTVKIVRD